MERENRDRGFCELESDRISYFHIIIYSDGFIWFGFFPDYRINIFVCIFCAPIFNRLGDLFAQTDRTKYSSTNTGEKPLFMISGKVKTKFYWFFLFLSDVS